jgi:hypothetical protein
MAGLRAMLLAVALHRHRAAAAAAEPDGAIHCAWGAGAAAPPMAGGEGSAGALNFTCTPPAVVRHGASLSLII